MAVSREEAANAKLMASEHVIRMMRSNGAPYPDDLLERMSDHECWVWRYANPGKPTNPKFPKPPPQKTVCFTGFAAARKEELMHIAHAAGWHPLQTAGTTMSHLCTGETPGEKKIEKALKQGTTIISESEFLALLESDRNA